MIMNPEGTLVLSSLGWVEGDAIWMLDAARGNPTVVPLESGARHVSLHASGEERFVVGHHFDGQRFELSVRTFADPGAVEARAVISDHEGSITGDAAAWRGLPFLFVGYLKFQPWQDFVLVRVWPSAGRVTVRRLEWYDDSYDKLYQGVTGVQSLPGDELALITVQRSSRLVLHDLDTGRAKRFIELANRGGNPRLKLRPEAGELWATDYDTLIVLGTSDWRVIRKACLQDAAAGTREFIGDFTFGVGDDCVVARPFSGDAVELDRNLKIRRKARLGRQPLEIVALHDGAVVARDWKTGDLLKGNLKRTWFAG